MSELPSDFREPHLRRGDFLGAFLVLEREQGILLVQNERTIAGRPVTTWDLPGGQVEPGELLHDALRRELREETRLELSSVPRLLFVQEGQKTRGGQRLYAWRSFFFAATATGEPTAAAEVRAVGWWPRRELPAVLTAPYHDSFRRWLGEGGTWFASRWDD